jgi:hypothetical protein
MRRFKKLTERLLKVDPEELRKAIEKEKAARAASRGR